MDVDSVAREFRELNGPHPVFSGVADRRGKEELEWVLWSAGENLVRKWEEQCRKRTEGAQEKGAKSTSMKPLRSLDYLGRAQIG